MLANNNASEYGHLRNYKNIDWGITSGPIVIAHAGAYSCSLHEVEESILPMLNTLLSKYHNLMIDCSGLNVDVLSACLKAIDHNRILFGSDALYHTQWEQLTKLFYTLHSFNCDIEKELVKIVSTNPSQYIFNKQKGLK